MMDEAMTMRELGLTNSPEAVAESLEVHLGQISCDCGVAKEERWQRNGNEQRDVRARTVAM